MSWAMAAGAAVTVIGGIVSKGSAKKAEKKARREQERIARQMAAFEANRQAITNPYAGVTSNEAMIEEMRNDLSNPFANLGVATQAAEIQMEQTDIALANTLDTLQATGASAGGATALAQAAKQSKKEVSANIEQQEAQNEKLRAKGEQDLQAKEMQLTQMEMSESARVQNAQAAGAQFMFNSQEARDLATLDRMSGQESQTRQDIANAQMSQSAADAAMISGISSMASAKIKSAGVTPSNNPVTDNDVIQPPVPETGTGTGSSGSSTSGTSEDDFGNGQYGGF
jgi:ribosomal protein S8E